MVVRVLWQAAVSDIKISLKKPSIAKFSFFLNEFNSVKHYCIFMQFKKSYNAKTCTFLSTWHLNY